MSNAYLNKVMLMGRTGSDADLRYTKSGKAVTNISLALQQHGYENPMWFKLVAWDKLAEFVVGRVGKGSQVFVEGELEQRTWTDSQGQQRTECVVHIERIEVVEFKPVKQVTVAPQITQPQVTAAAPAAELVTEPAMEPVRQPVPAPAAPVSAKGRGKKKQQQAEAA
jgi:single-strand DNA-binding protein